MQITLNGRTVDCCTAAITPLKYRVEYGRSALIDMASLTGDERTGAVCKLVAVSAGISPREVAACLRDDPAILRDLLHVERTIFESDPLADKIEASETHDNRSFDELDLLAVSISLGIPARWWDELPLLYIASLMSRMHRGTQQPQQMTKMTNEEMHSTYGISSARLAAAQAAIAGGGEPRG